MFKIGEFSMLTQVSIRMLRYYDETGLLKPAQIDEFSGYRLYSTEQIPILNKIVFLRDMGFNVSEITMSLSNWDNSFIINQLQNKRLEINNTIQAEQDKLTKIQLALKDIQQEKISIHYNVSIKNIPSYRVLSLRRIIPDYYAEGQLWVEMSTFADKNNIPISTNTFSIYHDMEYKENNVDVEICAPVSVMGENKNGFVYRNTAPVPIMACTMVYGEFKNIAKAYLSFANWLQQHNQYRMTGESRQIVHRGPWNESNTDKYLTELQTPLEKI